MAGHISHGALNEWKAGWPAVAASFLGTYLCVTFLYSFGFFIQPLEQTFGWSRSQITTGVTIVTITGALVHPLAGMIVDRVGAWRFAIPSVIFYSAAVALLATTGPSVGSWWFRCALVGVAYGCIASFMWLAATVARFDKGRGMAIALVQLGPATAMTTLPLIVHFLMTDFGWRGTFTWLALGGFLVVVPSTIFLLRPPRTDHPREARQAPLTGATFSKIASDPRAWRLLCAAGLTTFGVNGLSLHFVPLLTDSGITRETALAVAGLIGVGSLCGRFFCGILLGRFRANIIAAVAFCLPVLSCMMLLLGLNSPASLSVIAFLLGVALGTEVDCIAFIVARIFGLRRYATATAVLGAAMSCGSGTGPLAGAFINDTQGSYDLFLVLEAGVFLAGAILIASVGNRSFAPPVTGDSTDQPVAPTSQMMGATAK